MKAYLDVVSRGGALSEEQAEQAMHWMMEGKVDERQIAGLLMGLRARGETIDELTGFVRAMRAHAVHVMCDDEFAIDLCGTGGDARGTFNISTAASFVCAGAGVTVAKHGNRSVSSQCGSADVLSALGVEIDLGKRGAERCLREAGIAFLFARRFHPAMRHVAPVRRALAARTCFNILGPLCNPARIRRQLVGAFSVEAAKKMADVFARMGATHIVTLTSDDGLDEISLGAPTRAFTVAETGDVRPMIIRTSDYGIANAPVSALAGGMADENAKLLRALLKGETGPRRDVTLLNAAWALRISGRFHDMDACMAAARESIDSGAAERCLARLVEVSRLAARS